MKYVAGILAIILGTLMVVKTEWFLRTFGTNAWAEQHLGTSGGSRLMYKLLGVAIIIIAMLGMTGFLGGILVGLLGGIFGG